MGSIKEIEELSGVKVNDLHKQYLDNITFDCECGHKMERVKEVLDCWFESGSVPFARLHYPFENKDWFEKNLLGVELIGKIYRYLEAGKPVLAEKWS